MPKTRKHRLLLEPDQNFLLIAIASHEKGYHLSWILNKETGSHFIRSSDFRIDRKNTPLSFPVFGWEDKNKLLSYHLIANRSENGFLFDDLKNIDFFLHISPDPGESFARELQDQLKTLPVIYTCFSIDTKKYPSAGMLQFD